MRSRQQGAENEVSVQGNLHGRNYFFLQHSITSHLVAIFGDLEPVPGQDVYRNSLEYLAVMMRSTTSVAITAKLSSTLSEG